MEVYMENKDSDETNDIIKSIMKGLKDELETIKSEIKEGLKTELDNIRSTLKDEINDIRSGKSSRPDSPFPPDSPFQSPPHRPFDDFTPPGFIAGDDDRETNGFDIADFNKIQISGIFDVEIIQSDTYKVN